MLLAITLIGYNIQLKISGMILFDLQNQPSMNNQLSLNAEHVNQPYSVLEIIFHLMPIL